MCSGNSGNCCEPEQGRGQITERGDMYTWHGITYPPILCHRWILAIWKRFMCVHNWHLFDEYCGFDEELQHELYCDACEFSVALKD